ncbi:hypothetical protein B0H13DRAFT_1874644 [Mycena leptocephala]|nr:hypothetical protein B0H13DRAFT_1874644 [Mycena leptocephala]
MATALIVTVTLPRFCNATTPIVTVTVASIQGGTVVVGSTLLQMVAASGDGVQVMWDGGSACCASGDGMRRERGGGKPARARCDGRGARGAWAQWCRSWVYYGVGHGVRVAVWYSLRQHCGVADGGLRHRTAVVVAGTSSIRPLRVTATGGAEYAGWADTEAMRAALHGMRRCRRPSPVQGDVLMLRLMRKGVRARWITEEGISIRWRGETGGKKRINEGRKKETVGKKGREGSVEREKSERKTHFPLLSPGCSHSCRQGKWSARVLFGRQKENLKDRLGMKERVVRTCLRGRLSATTSVLEMGLRRIQRRGETRAR